MDIFKEIRCQYEVELKSAVEFEYEYANLLNIHRRFQAKNILLDNLEAEFMKFGREKFIEHASAAVLRDGSLCSPNLLFDLKENEISDLEKDYTKQLMAFNRQFLSKNLYKLNNLDLMKFLTESLLINNISKDFLVSIKSTDAEPKPSFWNFLSKMKVEEFFLTVYFWSLTIPSLLFTAFCCLIIYPFVDEKTFARCYESLMGYTLLNAMVLPGFWKINIVDLRQDKSWRHFNGEEKRFVVIANHLSYIDSLVPVFGFLTRNAGYVTAERGNTELNKTAVERAVATINKDLCSFVVYPEGKRQSRPYVFEEFKTGAYRIARQTNLQILPITLKGTYEAMHGIVVGRAEITVFIDDPFSIDNENYKFYVERSKTIFTKNLKTLKSSKFD